MTKRVLVTGGAGFIGSHLCELLLERGYSPVVLDHFAHGKREWLPGGVEIVEGNIEDLETCRLAMQGVEGVFHCAAMSRSAASLDNIEICTQSNVLGTQNVLQAGREAGIRRLVYSGSSTFYGNQPTPHHEDGPSDFLNFYGLTKYVGEEYCRMYDRLYDVPCVVLRYFNVYGPRQPESGVYSLVIGTFLKRKRQGHTLVIHGDGSQRRDFIHVRDVALANLLAYEKGGRGQTYNVGSGVSTSILEIADRIAPGDRQFEPRRQADSMETLADMTRTRRELGFEPTVSLSQGIEELLQRAAD